MESPNGSPKKVEFSADVKVTVDASECEKMRTLHIEGQIETKDLATLPHGLRLKGSRANADFCSIATRDHAKVVSSDAFQADTSISTAGHPYDKIPEKPARPTPTLCPPKATRSRASRIETPSPERVISEQEDCSSSALPDTPTSQSVPSLSVTSSPNSRKDDLEHMGGGGDLASIGDSAHESDLDLTKLSHIPRINSQLTDGGLEPSLAAIRGHGTPNLKLGARPGPPSEITDRGDEIYATLKEAGRTSSFPVKDTDEPLECRLFKALKVPWCSTPGMHSPNGILPKGQLDQLINEDIVFKELESVLGSMQIKKTMAETARKICKETKLTGDDLKPRTKSFKKIFAVLVLINKASTIQKFLDDDVSDIDLPLAKEYPDEKRKEDQSKVFQLRKRDSEQVLSCFDDWKPISVCNFEEYQWSFLSPYFAAGEKKNPRHYVLQNEVILPFFQEAKTAPGDALSCWQQEMLEGGESQVFKVVIHPEHHNLYDKKKAKPDENPCFAIRRKKSPSKVDFNKEVEILKRFSGDYDGHLANLLATYEQFNQYFLIFHWAESDLLEFWRNHPREELDTDLVVWIATQCAGLAGALHKIHNYRDSMKDHLGPNDIQYGRHGDIKPQNILLFRNANDPHDRGTLKLADFGLSEFRSHDSKSRVHPSQIGNTYDYRAPESDVRGAAISRSYDIWTLGCVYLEFICWALGGFNLHKKFTKARLRPDNRLRPEQLGSDWNVATFFELVEGGRGAQVKTAVIRHFEQFHKMEGCSAYFHDFLHLIQHEMLLVEPTSRDSKSKRIVSAVLYTRLKAMRKDVPNIDKIRSLSKRKAVVNERLAMA